MILLWNHGQLNRLIPEKQIYIYLDIEFLKMHVQ